MEKATKKQNGMLDTLSLEDAEKVKNSMSFKNLIDLLDTIFTSSDFSDERKFIIVMNFLEGDSEEEKKAKEDYLSLLDFNDTSLRKATPSGTKRKTGLNGEIKNSSNRYVYSDTIKWRFFKKIDPDARVIRYGNGYVEFASSKLGCRIIEKYYEKNEPAYGTATYIVPETVYRKNQTNLITATPKGIILEPVILKSITPKKDRIAHRTHSPDKTWMDEMVKYLENNYGLQRNKEMDDFIRKNKTRYDEIIK